MEAWIAITIVAVASSLGWLLMWVGGLKEHKSEVTKFMAEVRETLRSILLRLPPVPTGTTSPRHLTDYGETIRDKVGAPA